MEPMEALGAATRAFGEGLHRVGDADWTNRTPCTEWDVQTLVNHMLLGTRMAVQLLGGTGRDAVIAGLDDDLVGAGQPIESFERMAGEMVAAFGVPGALDGVVDHPIGEIPTRLFLSFRALDAAVHAWDLAQAIGGEAGLGEDLVRWLWDDIQPMAAGLKDTGIFGEGSSGAMADDAPLLHRYLDLLGRRP